MVFTLPNWYITLKSEDFGVANWVKSLAASQEIPAASGSPAILTAEDALGQKCDLLYMTYDASTVHHGKPVANCFTHQICPCVYTRRDDNRLEYLQTLELKRTEPIDSWWRPVTWSQDVSGGLRMSQYVVCLRDMCHLRKNRWQKTLLHCRTHIRMIVSWQMAHWKCMKSLAHFRTHVVFSLAGFLFDFLVFFFRTLYVSLVQGTPEGLNQVMASIMPSTSKY